MPYQVDRFNGTFLVSVADGTVDTTTDLRFLGKNYAGYGEVQNENFLHLLENFANTSPPPKAINGQVWYDSASKKLKYYDSDNTKWRTTGGLEVGATAPTKMNVGDFWYDTSADQLYSWNGNTFVLIGPQPTVGGSITATTVDVVPGINPPLNYNIVKLYAGSNNVIAVISNDEFSVNFDSGVESTENLSAFTRIKKGINLAGTNTGGVTDSSDLRFWGTASNALKLAGKDISQFVQIAPSGQPTIFSGPVAFGKEGFTVGHPDNNLRIFVELGDQPIIESRNSAPITMRIRENANTTHDIIEFRAPGASAGAAIPGVDSSFNLGSPVNKWQNVYANTFVGNLTGNVTGNTTGVHKGNILANDNSLMFNAATNTIFIPTIGSPVNQTIIYGSVIGTLEGTANNALALNNLQSSVETLSSTIVVRDTSGNINANNFNGTSTRSNQLLVSGIGYQSAVTAPTANTIVVRDGNGNINVNLVNGTATAANTIQADNSGYVAASTAAVGNTVVVRDFAGRINVTGINASATSADSLQVDGTTYRSASANAISNTIVSRDSIGAIKATSIDNTPIGLNTRSTGAFTTLTSNGITTITNSTAAINTGTGALVVTGGVGVAGSVHASAFYGTFIGNVTGTITGNTSGTHTGAVVGALTGTVGASSRDSGAFTTLTANSAVTFTANTASTSTSTGALVVTGGVGVGGQITANSFVETSSAVYKENINPIEDALNSILQLTGVVYDRKDKSSLNEAGLIAEDVDKVLPNVISYKDGKPEGIKYTKIIAYLVEAIKELKSEIEELKK